MITCTNTYFKYLLKYLNDINNLNNNQKNEYWKDTYVALINEIKNKRIDYLPIIMPLIYPDFLFNNQGVYLGQYIDFDKGNFSASINDADNCQFYMIQTGGQCVFNSYRDIRGKCQADHFWPHSLGGPAIIENRVLLCKFHNVAKSNSIMQEFWQ